MFEIKRIYIITRRGGVEGVYGTAVSRGRELSERHFTSSEKHNGCLSKKAMYITDHGEMVQLNWVRGNLGDVFLDHHLLPGSARIPYAFREETVLLP